MATAESDSIKQVREKIIQLAREIEEHSRSGMPPEAFFSEFLKRVVGAVGARAGAVWLRNGSNKLSLFTDLNLKSTGYFEKADASALNQKLLDEVLSNGQACTHSPNDGSGVQVPTNDLIVLAALQQQKQCVGVVEIFQRVDTPQQARPGFLQFVEQMCGYACRYLDRQSAPKVTAEVKQKITEQFEQFLLQLHRGLDIDEVTATAANDGRLLLGCDRLAVAVQYGKKTVIKAISGQDAVHQRANLVKRMGALANKVILMREPLTYTGKLDHLPPQITAPLADYIQESGSRMVTIWPLFESEPLVKADDKGVKKLDKEKKPIGGLIIEQISETQPRPGLQEKIESLADHVAEAMHNSQTYHRIFLLPLWRLLGTMFKFMEGRGKLKVLAGVLATAGVIAALCLVPWEYRVEGTGRLMPIAQKDVFAPWDGTVAKIHVNGGEKVTEGQLLLELRNEELAGQLLAAVNLVKEKIQLKYSLEGEYQEAIKQGNKTEEIRIDGKILSTEVEIKGATKQAANLQERYNNLKVYAAKSGTIATFEVERQLLHRPVRRGELLLEIKEEAGPWWLQLEVDERRMGHLLRAINAQRKKAEELDRELDHELGQQRESLEKLKADGQAVAVAELEKEIEYLEKQRNSSLISKEIRGAALPAEYVLATNPEDRFQGKLIAVESRSNAAAAKDRAVVRVRVDITKKDLGDRCRIGAEVTAKINCGKRSLGYVLFGDVVEFVQRYFWL